MIEQLLNILENRWFRTKSTTFFAQWMMKSVTTVSVRLVVPKAVLYCTTLTQSLVMYLSSYWDHLMTYHQQTVAQYLLICQCSPCAIDIQAATWSAMYQHDVTAFSTNQWHVSWKRFNFGYFRSCINKMVQICLQTSGTFPKTF